MPTNDDKENDYEFTRETLYDLIVKGREGIDEFMEVARQSEHPRAYEVLAKLIKDTADTSSQLMDLHKKKKEIEKNGFKLLDIKQKDNWLGLCCQKL